MESFVSRVVANSLIALFILLVPLFSGNPITWWNIAGAVAVAIVTVLSRGWYHEDKRPPSDRTRE